MALRPHDSLHSPRSSNSFGFGVSAYPLGYGVGPFADFVPLYGWPYRPVAVQDFSEHVADY